MSNITSSLKNIYNSNKITIKNTNLLGCILTFIIFGNNTINILHQIVNFKIKSQYIAEYISIHVSKVLFDDPFNIKTFNIINKCFNNLILITTLDDILSFINVSDSTLDVPDIFLLSNDFNNKIYVNNTGFVNMDINSIKLSCVHLNYGLSYSFKTNKNIIITLNIIKGYSSHSQKIKNVISKLSNKDNNLLIDVEHIYENYTYLICYTYAIDILSLIKYNPYKQILDNNKHSKYDFIYDLIILKQNIIDAVQYITQNKDIVCMNIQMQDISFNSTHTGFKFNYVQSLMRDKVNNHYTAPEIINKQESIKIDNSWMWSFGIILIELLIGGIDKNIKLNISNQFISINDKLQLVLKNLSYPLIDTIEIRHILNVIEYCLIVNPEKRIILINNDVSQHNYIESYLINNVIIYNTCVYNI